VQKFFSNVKVAIVIILLIVVFSILGTVILQNQDPAKYEELYGPILSKIILITSLNDVYHAGYFLLLLIALIVSIILCSYRRLINDYKRVFTPDLDKKINKFDKRIKLKLPYNQAFPVLIKFFKKKGFKVNSKKSSSKINVLLQKNLINAFGSHLTHISILITLIGSSIGAIFGFEYYLKVLKDQTIQIPNTSVQMRLDKFAVEYHPNSNMVSKYRSDVSLIDQDNQITKTFVEVNKPLNVEGIQFSQNSYGAHGFDHADFEITDQKTGKKLGTKHLKLGDELKLPDSYLLKVEEYVPDLRIGGDNKVFSASQEANNPAIRFSVTRKGKSEDFWTFKNYPKMGSHKKTRFAVVFKELIPGYYSVLQAKSDPGIEIVLAGFILMTIGVFAIYIINYYRISMVITKGTGNSTQIDIKGSSRRNKEELKTKIDQLILNLKKLDQ
jgi:cytochrome c biogenesis protein